MSNSFNWNSFSWGLAPVPTSRMVTFSSLGDSQSSAYTRTSLLWNQYLTVLSNGKYVQWTSNNVTAVAGATVNDLFNSTKSAQIQSATNPKSGQVVFVQTGTSDQPAVSWVADDLVLYKEQLRTAVGLLLLAGKFVVMFGMPPKSGVTDAVTVASNEARRDIANELGIPFLDLYELFNGTHVGYTDGVHFTALGAYTVASAAKDLLDTYFISSSDGLFGGGINYPNSGTTRGIIYSPTFANTGTFSASTGGGMSVTKSVPTEAGIVGNIAQCDYTGTVGTVNGDFDLSEIKSVAGAGTQWAVGDVLMLVMKVRCKDFTGSASVGIYGVEWGGTGQVGAFEHIAANNWHDNTLNDTGWLNLVYIVKPTGAPTGFQPRLRVSGTGAWTAKVMCAEVMIVNLSQLQMGGLFA